MKNFATFAISTDSNMKQLAILFFLFAPTLAHAQSTEWFDALGTVDEDIGVTEVTLSSLKLLGTGVENRQTGESMALACVGKPVAGSNEPNCDLLHWVYFNAEGTKAFFAGYSLRVQSEASIPNHDEIKAEIKLIKKRFKNAKSNRNQKYLDNHRMLLTSTGLMGMGALFFVGTMGTAAVVTAATAGLIYVVIGFNRTLLTMDPASATLNKQVGWNWSSRPKKISHKNFEMLRSLYW